MLKLSSLSMIFPAYNEEGNIEKVIKSADSVAKVASNVYEIIIINDGSKDRTKEIAENLIKEYPNLKVINQKNMGYGGALKAGFTNASKDWIFFSDSDLQFDFAELKRFVPYSAEYDFIFGYRIKRADKFIRKVIVMLLKIWNFVFLGFPLYIKDIDCAFKLMKRSSFESIGSIISSGAMINSEFILKIQKKDYKILQIGVKHYPRVSGKSTGSNLNVIKKAIRETFTLRKLIK